MADEARVQVSLRITNGNLQFQSRPTSFNADVAGSKAGSPGQVRVAVTGTNVDLSALNDPSFCVIQNLDDTNYLEYGIYDPEITKFYPLGEVLPGEIYVLRLARNLGWEYDATGTGSTGPETNRLRLRANTAALDAAVYAFEV